MDSDEKQLLPLDIERAVVFRSGSASYRHVFRRIGWNAWERFYNKIEAEIENGAGGSVTRIVSAEAATLWLYSNCVLRAEGYRVSDGRKLEDLPQWRERIPQGHRLKAANVLMQVTAQGGAEDVIEAEGETVTLSAIWSEQDGGMAKYSRLVHRFATPTNEHRHRLARARARAQVTGGSRSGRTVIPSAQPVLAALYDELIVSVEGYAMAQHPISGREEIAREMDGYHKVVAAGEIFNTFMPEDSSGESHGDQ